LDGLWIDYGEIMKRLCMDLGGIVDRFWRDYGYILEGF